MRGAFTYGKGFASSTTALRSFRTFRVNQPKRLDSNEKQEPPQVSISMDPATQAMEPAVQSKSDDVNDDEDEPLPGDTLRMQYELAGKGWMPVSKNATVPGDAKDIGNDLDMLINRDVIQKIAAKLNINIPFRMVKDILKRNHIADMSTITNLKKVAHDLMAVFDKETRTIIPPKYRTRLVQMLARAMHAYIAGKGTQLTGTGARLKKKLDPNAYHPHAQAFIRGLTLAMKPAMSLGATALSLSPSVTGKIVAPFLQAAASSL